MWEPMKYVEATPEMKSEREKQLHTIFDELVTQGVSQESADKNFKAFLNDEIWLNDIYQANVRRKTGEGWFDETEECWNGLNEDFGEIIWISIKRRDKEAIHDWRDFQSIKNDIAGPDMEAVEIYPAESRLMDTANQYHLFAFKGKFPVGFQFRCVSDDTLINSKQRPIQKKGVDNTGD